MSKNTLISYAFMATLILALQTQPLYKCIYAAEGDSDEIQEMTDEQLQAELNKYSSPVATMGKSSSGTTLSTECMGGSDYTPIVPDTSQLDSGSVTSASYFSPANLGNGWYIWDHVGITDEAYQGKRHVVKRSSGIQWFGYYAPPYNDMMLRDFTSEISSNNGTFNINIKQAPVRADWHTINGSGVLFGVTLNGVDTTGTSLSDFDKVSIDTSNGDVSTTTGSMSGFAFVATNKYNELRYYNNVTLQDFIDGTCSYLLIEQQSKTCNSQSLTVDYSGGEINLYVGSTKWNQTSLKVGDTIDVYDTTNQTAEGEKANSTLTIPIPGTWAGAMVDYANHSCSSLSSVYMFNFTFNSEEYF